MVRLKVEVGSREDFCRCENRLFIQQLQFGVAGGEDFMLSRKGLKASFL